MTLLMQNSLRSKVNPEMVDVVVRKLGACFRQEVKELGLKLNDERNKNGQTEKDRDTY